MQFDLANLDIEGLNSLFPERPKRNPIAAGLSSGVDSLQGLGYSALGGVSDAVGLDSARDWLNEQAARNALEAQQNGRPDLERIEDQSLGTALPYAAYQISKQVPLMGSIMAANLIPGVGQAATATGLARLGAVAPKVIGGGGLQAGANFAARRAALQAGEALASEAMMGTALGYGSLYGESVEGGDPSPFAAAALAPFYGLAEAAVPAAVRGALRAPVDIAGNLGTRMLKAGGLGALGESSTELVQNEMEMALNGNVSPEEAFSRRLNSAVAGGIVGGPLGSLGGIRKPLLDLDDQSKPTSLLGGSYNLTTDMGALPPLQERINKNLGLTLPQGMNKSQQAEYAKLFNQAYNQPSGRRAVDPATGVERELTVGELLAREAELEQASAGDVGRVPLTLAPYGPTDGPLAGAAPSVDLETLRSDLGELAAMAEVAQRRGDAAQLEALNAAMRQTFDQIKALETQGTAGQSELFFPNGAPTYGADAGLPNLTTQLDPLQERIDQNLGLTRQGAPRNYPQQFQAAASEPTNLFAQDPATGREIRLDMGQASQIRAGDNVQLTPEQIRAQEVGTAAAQEKQAIEGRKERTAAAGLDPKKVQHVQAWSYIEEALDNGVIDQPEAARLAANVASGIDKVGGIQKYLTGLAATKQAIADGKAQETQAALDKVQKQPTNGTPTPQAKQAAPQGPQAPAAATPAAAVSTQAPVATAQAPVEVAGTVKERVRQRLNAWAEQFPQMPKYDWLSNRELAQLEDLENRGELNLSALQTVVGKVAVGANEATASAPKKYTPMDAPTVVKRLKEIVPLRPTDSNRPKDPTAAAVYDERMANYKKELPSRDDLRAALLHALITIKSPQIVSRLKLATGFDVDVENGPPRLIQVNNPAPLVQVAEYELSGGNKDAKLDPQKVRSLEASISKQLGKSNGFYQEVIDKIAANDAPASVSTAELGPVENGRPANYQTGDTISEVTGTQLTESPAEHVAKRIAAELKLIAADNYSDEAITAAYQRLAQIETRDAKASGKTARNVDETAGGRDELFDNREAVDVQDAIEQQDTGTEDAAEIKANAYTDALAEALANRVLNDKKRARTRVALGDAKLDAAEQQKRKLAAIKSAVDTLRLFARQPGFTEAASAWNSLRSDKAPEFDQLPVVRQAAWVQTYFQQLRNVNDQTITREQFRWELDQEQRSFESGADFALESQLERAATGTGNDQAAGPDSAGGGGSGPATTEPQDVGTRAKAKLKAAGQNVAKADLSDEELAWAIQTYEKLGNKAKAAEAKKVADSRQAAAPAAEDRPATPFVPRGVASNDGQKAQAETGPDTRGDGKDSPVSGQRAGERTRESRKAQNGSKAVSTPVRAYSVEGLLEELKRFIRSDSLGRNVRVIASLEDLAADVDRALLDDRTQAVFRQQGGRTTVYLIADRIQQGTGRSVFLHEVGVHAGLERLLPRVAYEKLYQFLMNKAKAYSAGTDKSLEAKLAHDAAQRMSLAGVNVADLETLRSELVAYFVEEAVNAGVDPTASSKLSAPLRSWFRNLWAAFKTALRKLGFNTDKLAARDIVDLAYGAARLEVAGTWHGTAANFRKFNHAFMGSGEGAQAYGWGTYLAQDPEIAEWYFTTDVKRKAKGGGIVGRDGIRISPKREAGETFAALDFSTTKGDIEAARKKFAARNLRPEARALGEAFLTRLEAEGAIYVPPSAPDGVLMRVDTSFNESELLDWDTTLDKQSPKVRAVVENLLDEYGYGELKSSKGKLIYETLADEFGYESMGKNGAQALSEELDRRGVPGIKFLDVNSRNASKKLVYKGTTYDGDQLRELARQARDSGDAQKSMELLTLNDVLRSGLDKVKATLQDRVRSYEDMLYKITTDSAAKFGVSLAPDEARARAKEDANDLTEGKTLAWLEANAADITIVEADQTRNLVVFNDKDIQRVASRVANQRDRTLFSKAAPIQKPAYMSKAPSELWETAQGAMAWLKDWTFTRGAFTRDLLNKAAELMPAAKTYLDEMQRARVESVKLEREVASIVDDASALAAHERGTGPRSINALIRRMTYENKWAFEPDWVKNVKPDAELAEWFDGLSKEAQAVVKRVFKHGHDSLLAAQRAAIDSIESEVNPLIDAARAKGDLETVKELEKAKVQADGKFRRLIEIRGQTPYAPLRRFGNWAVVVKSKMYQDAQARGDEAEMDRLSRDGNHYRVEFKSNQLSATARAKALQQELGDVSVQAFERGDDALLYGGESMFKAFSRFRNLAREKIGAVDPSGKQTKAEAEVTTALDKTLASMYMALVAETSARTSEFERKNVAGADMDMMRAFATQGRAMANFIGSLKTSGKIMDTLRTMKKQTYSGTNQAEKSKLYNEILRRHAMGLNYEPNQLLDKSLAANSYWSLITSPSYLLTNLTQPWVVSVPVLAGKFGLGRSSSEMMRAYKEIGRIATKLVDNPDAVKDLPKDVQAVVSELFNRGSIDISLGADLGSFTSGGDSELSARTQKILRLPRTLAERGEMVNRVATAVAAYRLAKAQKMSTEDAINYADKVIYETHGDYSAFNAPRVMRNPVGRFATQFRKFQLIQIALYGRLIKDATKSLDPKERKAAQQALLYTLGTTFTLGGLTAMPGYTAISFLAGSVLGLGDDDEPDDPEATLRRLLGGGAEADVILRGVPNLMGLNIGNRIGAAGMLSILPYTDLEASRDGYKDILLGLAGPFFGGTLPKALDGVGLISNGDYYKGLELLMPRGVADGLRGWRFFNEGVSKRNGDVTLSADEINFFEMALQAVGLPPKDVTDNQMLRNSQFKADEFYKDRTSQLKRQYVEAYRDGDGATMQEVRQSWMETQDARRRLGIKVQPLSELLKAPQEQRKRESKLQEESLLMG